MSEDRDYLVPDWDSCEGGEGLRGLFSGPLAERRHASIATVGDLVRGLSALFPPTDAEPWDKTGLLAGDASWPIGGVATALDPTVEAVRQAQACGANVLLTHHPAYLDAPAPVCPRSSGGSAAGAVVFEALSRGVALVNYHTALDVSAPAQHMLPGMLSLERVGVLEPLARDSELGYGQVCAVASADRPMTLESLALRCTAVFGRAPRVWGAPDKQVESVVTWTGSAGPAAEECLERGVDALICGEVKYHAALDAASAGLGIIELGHDVSELPFAAVLAQACASIGVSRESISCLAQDANWIHPESRRV